MDKINYSEVLFQSIDQIVEERLKQVQYDRTIACEILEAHPEENLYWVNCEGLKIQVSSIDPKKIYSENTLVYVLVPNGNYENTKVIIGGYSAKDIEKKTYNNSYDNFIPNKTFYVIGENNPIVLSVKNLNVQETDAIPYSPIQYNREYDYVGVHWSMQTYQLFDANITSGQYTLEIVFGNQTDDAIVSYPIHSSSIYGNPYSLSEDFEQYTLFPYSDKLNTCTHFKIRLYQGVKDETNPENRIDQFNYTGTDNPQIILCSLDLSVGYTNTDFKEEQSLNIGKNESLNYKLNDSNSLERTLYFDWRIIDKNKDNQIFNYNNSNFNHLINNAHIYWLQYQENEGYQSFEELTNINFEYASIEGLYNWKIIDNNKFELPVDIDTDYQTDQYKIFIVYDHWVTTTDEQGNEIQEQHSDYAFTNTIIFENLDIAPIQPGAATADKPNSLNLKLNEGNTGVYNVYGLDGRMVESSKQGPYSIKASLYDSLEDKIDKVEWIFPSSNTMIVDARDDNWDKLPNNEKLTVKYRIKTQYYSSATFNIIQCKITMTTGEIRNASVSLQFGEIGNQGTNYAFNIDFIDKDHLTYGQDEEIQIKATLSNQNGEEVLLEHFIDKLEWSWLFVETPAVINNKENSAEEIVSISNIVCSKHENNIVKLKLNNNFDFTQANYSILQAKLEGYNTGDNIKTDLLTYLCVPVAAADIAADNVTIKPRSMQGAARVVYDSLGTATTYSKEAYEIINENGTQVADLTWELFTDTKYSGLPALTESKVKKQNIEEYIIKYKIKPSSYVPPKIPPVSIVAKTKIETEDVIIWSQPILITQNTWFNESINEWTDVLSINHDNDGTILAPLLIAGTKTFNNLFSGVTVGQLAIGREKVNGVYGFSQGKARFWLNEDAEFYVGDSKDKNIHLDANGNFSIVAKSFDFRTPEEIQNKLILSSANQEFQIGNENSYLRFYTPEGESQKKFEIKTNDLEFNSTNYNGFSMRVGKEGFYTGTEDEYISFEKEDDGYSRTLKINAKNFELTTDYITLSSSEHYLLIRKSIDANSDRVRAGYIRTEDSNKIYGLDIYGGALRIYTKESSTNPALWVQDSKIYLKGRITNEYNTTPRTWMTMGYPDTSEGSDGGSGFRIFNTDINGSDSTPVFKIWPGYVDGKYNAMVISGYQKIKLCPYVIPNNQDTKTYSSYLEVHDGGGRLYGNWQFDLDQKFNKSIYAYNLGIYRDNTITAQLYRSDSKKACFASMDGSDVCLVIKSGDTWSTKLSAKLNDSSILYGSWDFSQDQKFSYDIGTTQSFEIYNGDTLVGDFYKSDNNLILSNKSTGNFQLGVGGYNFIRGHREYGYSKAIIYNYDLREGSDIIVDATKVGSVWWDGNGYYYTGMVSGYGWGIGVDGQYRIAANGGGGDMYGTWTQPNWSSDARIKHSIESLNGYYEILFDNLQPKRYKYNNGTSNRYHTGFIAQEVLTAVESAGLTTQDFAAMYLTERKDSGLDEPVWILRRDEFVALNTWQIQKLKTRVTELENEIKEIKKRYEI